MDHDFGKRLIHARLARGVTVEEAAHALRMRPGLIRALEDSNLTQFPNAAYAKSFLLMYSKYLNVDMVEMAERIDTSTQMRVEDFQYLTSRTSEEKRLQRDASGSRYDSVIPRKKSGSWLPLIVIVAVGSIGLIVFVVITNLHRFDSTVPPAKSLAGKPPRPTPTPGSDSAANPPPAPGGTSPAVPNNPTIAQDSPGTPVSPPLAPDLVASSLPPPSPGPAANPPANEHGTPGNPLAPVVDPTPVKDEETTAPPLPAGTVVLEPMRKTWIIIRTGPGGQPLYEDFLYPTAKPMHLPAGRYFIELRDATGVEISKDGKNIAYTAPGVLVD